MGISEDRFLEVLSGETEMTLATCAGDRVTIRTVSFVNIGMTIYFYTDNNSTKACQIRENANVAATVEHYQIEARARVLGHPRDKGNSRLADVYRAKFPGAFSEADETVTPDTIFVAMDVARITEWVYENGGPVGFLEADYRAAT